MPSYYSPEGNYEVWDRKPMGYFTDEEWANLHPVEPPPEPTPEEQEAERQRIFNQAKEDKLAEIIGISSNLIKEIESQYSYGEVMTFSQQYDGAKNILAGNEDTVDAQFVLRLLSVRIAKELSQLTTEDKTEFANRIISNHTQAQEFTILILGTQQNLEAQIKATTTIEEVEAIKWPEEVTVNVGN